MESELYKMFTKLSRLDCCSISVHLPLPTASTTPIHPSVIHCPSQACCTNYYFLASLILFLKWPSGDPYTLLLSDSPTPYFVLIDSILWGDVTSSKIPQDACDKWHISCISAQSPWSLYFNTHQFPVYMFLSLINQ